METRTKIAEARFHEDKLKIQQQHDLSIQKVRVMVNFTCLLYHIVG